MDKYRILPVRREQQFLVPPSDDWSWGKNLQYNKDSLVRMIAGTIVHRKDKVNMDNFLKNSALSSIQTPQEESNRKGFNPIVTPILDLMAIDRDRADSWNVPTSEYITRMQADRGLSLDMIARVEVREILVGVTAPEKLKETIDWMWERYRANQAEMPTAVLSLDVEEIPGHLYDEYRLIGKILHLNSHVELSLEVDTEELVPGERDKNVQIPVRIMLGDGITWCLMITIIADPKNIDNGYGRRMQTHMIKKFVVQPEIIELIRTLPLVTGVGIKNDVTIIEQHYSLYSGEKVEMAGFLELGSLLVLAGWRAINANMPVIHAIVTGDYSE